MAIRGAAAAGVASLGWRQCKPFTSSSSTLGSILKRSCANLAGIGLAMRSTATKYGEADPALFADIVRGVMVNLEQLDATISAVLTEEWPLPRLDAVLRAILRAGAYELVHRRDVPPRVSISEYTAVAYAFFSGKEPGWANGVLDKLGRTLRTAEI